MKIFLSISTPAQTPAIIGCAYCVRSGWHRRRLKMRKIVMLFLIVLFIGCCPPQYQKQQRALDIIIEDIQENLESFQAEDMQMQVDYLKARMRHLQEELK
jgi:hypothetical protein